MFKMYEIFLRPNIVAKNQSDKNNTSFQKSVAYQSFWNQNSISYEKLILPKLPRDTSRAKNWLYKNRLHSN